MPRHYPHGLPRAELLRLQHRDLEELLTGEPSYYEKLPHGDAILTGTLDRRVRTDLELLAKWVDDEIAAETGEP